MSKVFKGNKTHQQVFKALVALMMLLAPYVFAAVVVAQTEPPPPGQAIGIDTSGGNLSPGAASTDPTARRYQHVPTNTITEMAEQNTNEVATNVSELLDSELGDYNDTYMGIQKFWGEDIIGNFFQNIGQLIGQWISELIDGWVAETVAFLTAFLRTFVLNPNIAVNGITNNPNGGPSNDDISPWIRGAADVMYGIAVDLLLLLFILCIWKYWADTAWRGGASLMSAVGRLIFTAGIMLAWPTIYAFWIQISNEMIEAIYFNSADQVAQLDAAMAAAVRAGLLATTGLIVHAFAPVLGQVAGGALGGGPGGLVGGEIGGVLSTFGLIIYLILGGVLIAQLVYLLVLKSIQTALLTAQYMFAPIFLVCFATPDTEQVASGFVKAFIEVSLWTFVWVGLLKIMVIILASDFNPWGKIVLAVGVLQLMIQVPSFMARASISPMSDFISAGLVTGGLLSAGKTFGNFLANRSQQWQKSITEWGDSGARGARQSQDVKMDRLPDQAANQKHLKDIQNAANGDLGTHEKKPPTKGDGTTAQQQNQQGQELRNGVQNNTNNGEQGPNARRNGATDQTQQGRELNQQGQQPNALDAEAARRRQQQQQQQQGAVDPRQAALDAARQQQQQAGQPGDGTNRPPSVGEQLARDVGNATRNAATVGAVATGAAAVMAGSQAGAALQRKEGETDEQFAKRQREAEDERQRLAAAAQLAAQLGEKELNRGEGTQNEEKPATPPASAGTTSTGKQTTTEGQDRRQQVGPGQGNSATPVVTPTVTPTTATNRPTTENKQPATPTVSPGDVKAVVPPLVTPTAQTGRDQQRRDQAGAPTVTDAQGRQVATQSTGDGVGSERGEHVANVETEEDLEGILGTDKDGRPLRVNFNTNPGKGDKQQQGQQGTPPVQTSRTGNGAQPVTPNTANQGGTQRVEDPRSDRPQGGRIANGWTGAPAQVASTALGAHAVAQGRNLDPTTANVAEVMQEGDGGDDGGNNGPGGTPSGAGAVPPAAKKSALSTFLQPLYRWVAVRSLANDTRIAKGPTMGTSPDGRPTVVGDTKGNVAHVRFGKDATEEQKALQFMSAAYAQTYSSDIEAYDAARQSAIDAGEDRPQGMKERIAAGILAYNGGSFRQTALAKQRFQRSLFKHAVEGAEAYVSGQQGNAFTEHLRTRYGDMTPEQQAWGIHMLTDGTSPESGWNPACGPATETLSGQAMAISATNRAVAANPAVLKSPQWQRGPAVRGVARYVNAVADSRCGPGTTENERDALVGFIGPNLSPEIVGACTAIALESDGSDCERQEIVQQVAKMGSSQGEFPGRFDEAYRVVRNGTPAINKYFGGGTTTTDGGNNGGNNGGGSINNGGNGPNNGGGGFTPGGGGNPGGGNNPGGGFDSGGNPPIQPQPQPSPQGGGLTVDLAGNVVQGQGAPGVTRTIDAAGTIARPTSYGTPQVGSLQMNQPTATPTGRQQAVVNFTTQDGGVVHGGSMNLGTMQGAAGHLSGTDVIGARTVQGAQGTVLTNLEGTLRQGNAVAGAVGGVNAPQVIGGGSQGVARVVFNTEGGAGTMHGGTQQLGIHQAAPGSVGATDIQQAGSIAGQHGQVTHDLHGTVLQQQPTVTPLSGGVNAPTVVGGGAQGVARVVFNADGAGGTVHGGTQQLGVHQAAPGSIGATDIQQAGTIAGQHGQVVTHDLHGTVLQQQPTVTPVAGVNAPNVVGGGAQGVARVVFNSDGSSTVQGGQQNLGVHHASGSHVAGTDVQHSGVVAGQHQQVLVDAQGTVVAQPVTAQPITGVAPQVVNPTGQGVARVVFNTQDAGGTVHGAPQNLGVHQVGGGQLTGTDIQSTPIVSAQPQQIQTELTGTIVSQPVSAQPIGNVQAPQVIGGGSQGVARVVFNAEAGGTVQGAHQNLGTINAGAGQLLGTDVVIGQVSPGTPGVVTTHVDATLRQGAPVVGNVPQVNAPNVGGGSRTEARVVFSTESSSQPTVHQRQVIDQPGSQGGTAELNMGSVPVTQQQPTIVQVDAVLRQGQSGTPVVPQVGPINTGTAPKVVADVNVISAGGQGSGGTTRLTQEVQGNGGTTHDTELRVSGNLQAGHETRQVQIDAQVRTQSGSGSQPVPVIPLGAIPTPQTRVTDRVDINIQGGGGNQQGTVHRMAMDMPLPTEETHGPLDVRVVGGNSGSSDHVENTYHVDVQAQRGSVSSSSAGMDGMIQSAAQQAAGGSRDTMQILTNLIMDMSAAGFTPRQMQDPKIMDAAARIYREDPAMLHTAAVAARVLGPQDFSYESTQVVQTMMDSGWNANQISRPDVVTAQIIMQAGGDMPGGGSYPTPDYVREVRRHPDFLPTFPRSYNDPGRAQMEYERVVRQEAALAEMAAERLRRRTEEGGVDGFQRKTGGRR